MARESLLEKGWRRFSIISLNDDSRNHLYPNFHEITQSVASLEEAIIVVATYDCAVVHDSFDAEPWVQLVVAFPVDFNKQFAQGRDPRRIHFVIDHAGKEKAFETNAACFTQIDRKLLCHLSPDDQYSLPTQSKYDLKNWLAERFKQDTWPDAFNRAIKPCEKRLKSFWKRYNEFVSSLYLRLNTYDELDSGMYTAAIILAIENGKQRKLMEKVRQNNSQLADKPVVDVITSLSSEIATIFDGAINFEEDPTSKIGKAIEIVEESGITLYQLREFYRFSPYSLSQFGEDNPLPVDMLSGKSV